MKPIYKYMLIGLVVVLAAGMTAVGVAYAQGDPPRGQGALAELLGLDVDQLRELIQSGKTIQELADEAGVDLDQFREEMAQARQDDIKARIEQALANGEITREHADWLLEGLDQGFLNGPFIGFGGRGDGAFGSRPGLDGGQMPGMRCGRPDLDQ